MREIVRQVQSARKSAQFNVNDRIRLALISSDVEVKAAIDEHTDTIKTETLALDLNSHSDYDFSVDAKIDDSSFEIKLSKAK